MLAEAKSIADDVDLLSAYEVTSLHGSIAALPGGQEVADKMVANWLTKYREQEPVGFNHDSLFKRELHPDIEAEFEAQRARANPLPSLLEVCVHIIEKSGWGSIQEEAMKASTPEQYEAEIRRLSGRDLKTFMLKSMEMYVQRDGYVRNFGNVPTNFVAACRSICQKDDNPRRTTMIRLVFSESKLESLLDVNAAATPSEALSAI